MTEIEAFKLIEEQTGNKHTENGEAKSVMDELASALEAVVMDAAMSGAKATSNAAKATGMNPTGTANVSISSGQRKEQTPAEHMAQYHKDGFIPGKNKCILFDEIKANLEKQGFSPEQAMQRAYLLHNGAAANINAAQVQNQEMPQNALVPQTQTPQGQLPNASESTTPQNQEEKIEEMVQNPEQILSAKSQLLLNGAETVETEEGPVPTNTDVQMSTALVLAEALEAGGDKAQYAREAVKKLQEITGTSNNNQENSQERASEQGQEQTGSNADPNVFTSENGLFRMDASQEAQKMMEKDPEKRKVFQKIVDAFGRLYATKDAEEQAAVKEELLYLREEFNTPSNTAENSVVTSRNDVTPKTETNASGNNSETPALPPPEPPKDDSTPPSEPPKDESTPPPEPPKDDSTPPPEPPKKESAIPSYEDEIKYTNTDIVPGDSDFETRKEGVYKVGGREYVDVSNKGFLHGVLSSFMAGLRGQDIITGWDRISGKWDSIKRSAKGEALRGGIATALFQNEINKYKGKKLSDDAKAELLTIEEMFQNAKDVKQRLAAQNKFKKWKEENGFGSNSTSEGEKGNFTEEIINGLQEMHKGGKCITGSKALNSEGKIVEDSVPAERPQPGADVLGAPKYDNKAHIDNLEEKIEKVKQYINNNLGVPVGEVDATTSFNQTFITLGVENAAIGNMIAKHAQDLMGELGSNDVKVVYDPKSKKVVVAVDNTVKGDVTAKEMFDSKEWKQAKKTMKVPLAIGKDNEGKAVIVDLKKLVHLLIGGQTGKGKSETMNTILTSIMMGRHPDDVKMVLIDPKGVEFGAYKNSKHNLLPVAETATDAIEHLKWVCSEMENRKKLLNETNQKYHLNLKNIDDYNDWAKANGHEKMPRIVVAIDEVTELMKTGGQELNALTGTLGNLARFTGIHVVAATQHPTKKNIGDMKDNFPSRIGFATKNKEGSEAILGHGEGYNKQTGEHELGTTSINRPGEFLMETDSGKQIHGQAAALGADDVDRVNQYWANGEVPPAKEEKSATTKESSTGSTTSESKKTPSSEEKPSSPAPKSEEPKKKKVKKLSDLDRKVNINDLESLKAYENRVQEAINAINSEAIDFGDLEKREKELQPFKEELDKIHTVMEQIFPGSTSKEESPKEDSGEIEESKDLADKGSEADEGENKGEEKYESPLERAMKPENRIESAKQRYESAAKELEKRIGAKKDGITHQQYLEELKKLDADYNDYVQRVKNGESDADIYAAREEANKKKEAAEQADLEKKRKLVTTKRHGRPAIGATHILKSSNGKNIIPMPKNISDKVKLPDGFAIDTDEKGRPLMKKFTKRNVGYARHPNGSWGIIDEDGKFKLQVDTTSPDILGEDHPDTKAAYKKWQKANEANSPDEEKALKDYNKKAFGVEVRDEAPLSNIDLVANAVAKALALNEKAVVG